VVRASRPQDGPPSFKIGLRARRAHHSIAPEDFELLWCGRLARMVTRCLGDPEDSTGEPVLGSGLLRHLRCPSVAQSAWSFSGNGEGVDHADCASGGLLLNRNALDTSVCPWSARQRHCAQRVAAPVGHSGTIACPARPVGAKCPPSRWLLRLRLRSTATVTATDSATD